MLDGKYWDAKRSLNEAKNRLAQADPANAKTLAAEIAMGIAIINSGPAQEAFARDIAAGSASQPADANLSAPANTMP